MLINLSELFSCQGKMKTYTPDLEMIQCPTPDGVCEIVEKGPISLTIVNEGDRKMHMEGSVRLSLSMPCSRCLEPVTVPFELEIDQELDLSQTEEERVEALDEQPYISGYNLDVDQLVLNELLLNLPMKVLCKEDCKGICNRCGTNLNRGTCDCEDTGLDPRMSVVRDLFKNFKEV